MFVLLLLTIGTFQGLYAAEIQSRIIGGESPTTVGKYPFIVSIKDAALNHMCAGAIIDSRWIVTSAVCLHGKENLIKYVGAGSDSKTSKVLYSVMSIFVHEYYCHCLGSQDFDIALIKTTTTITYTSTIKSIPLSSSYIGKGVGLTVIGWGISDILYPPPNTIKEATLYSITNVDCSNDLDREITDTQLCATYNGRGACIGDWGSPVIANGRLEGIVIKEDACGNQHDIYTRIYPLISWINTVKKR